MKLAQRLTEQRRKHKKTQNDIAKILNVNRATVGLWETGTNAPPIDKLVVLADYYNVSIDYLCGREMETNEFIYQELSIARELCATLEMKIGGILNAKR